MILVDEQKLVDIAENIPKVFNAGYEKGKTEGGTAKAEQEKSVTITQNGTTEVLPDDNKVLSKVNVEVDVPSDDSKLCEMISRDIEEIVIPKNITKIGRSAFAYSKLKKVTIPENVTAIGISAFERCGNLAEIIMSNSVRSIDGSAFVYCNSLSKFTFPPLVKVANTQVLAYCDNLADIDLCNVETLDRYAFYACKSLKNLILPQTVTAVKRYAFATSGLESITLPSSITTLENDPFEGCTTLRDLIVNCEIKSNFILATCLNLTSQSVDSVTNALADLTGKMAQTLTLHTDVKAKLTEEQISAITSKNWNLA